jgi:hypothetical protein
MMSERSEHNPGLMRRGVIMTLALMLLAAQSFSIAHYHQKDFRDNLTHATQGSDALCSLCLFHFHAPANAGAPPDVGGPVLAVSRLTPQAVARLHALAIARVLSRGPPFSL